MRVRLLCFLTFLLAGTAARADTETVLVSFNGFYGLPFNKFDTSLGTLTSYSVNINFLAYSTTPLDLVFKSDLGTPIFEVAPPPSPNGYYNFTGSGSLSSAADLAAISSSFFPTLRYSFYIQDLDSTTGIGYVNPGGTLTFNYTPAGSAPEIDPSLSASGLILLAGGIVLVRERRRMSA